MEPKFDEKEDEVACSIVAHVAGTDVRVSLLVLDYSSEKPLIQVLHSEEV